MITAAILAFFDTFTKDLFDEISDEIEVHQVVPISSISNVPQINTQ